MRAAIPSPWVPHPAWEVRGCYSKSLGSIPSMEASGCCSWASSQASFSDTCGILVPSLAVSLVHYLSCYVLLTLAVSKSSHAVVCVYHLEKDGDIPSVEPLKRLEKKAKKLDPR